MANEVHSRKAFNINVSKTKCMAAREITVDIWTIELAVMNMKVVSSSRFMQQPISLGWPRLLRFITRQIIIQISEKSKQIWVLVRESVDIPLKLNEEILQPIHTGRQSTNWIKHLGLFRSTVQCGCFGFVCCNCPSFNEITNLRKRTGWWKGLCKIRSPEAAPSAKGKQREWNEVFKACEWLSSKGSKT